MATIRLIPSTYELSNTQYLSVSNASNMYANTDSTTYASVTNSRTQTTNYYIYIRGFNFSDVPSNATIDSFNIKIKCNYNGGYSQVMYLYNGTGTSIGRSETTITSTLTTHLFNPTKTWEEIVEIGENFGIRINCRRNAKNQQATFYIYGAEIEVNYTTPYVEPKSYVKKNNAFVETTNQYVKESNSWINRTISKIFWKINGNWSETNDSMSGKTAFKVEEINEYFLDNCVVNLDGVDSYNNRYEDTTSGFEGDMVYPFGMSGNFMRGFDVIADGKSFEFNGTTSYMRPAASASFDNYLYTGYTIEILFEPLSLPSTDGDAFTLFVGRNSKQTIAIYCYYYTGSFYFIKSSGVSSKLLVIPSISLNEKHYIAANADGWMFDGGYYPDSESTASTNSVGTNDILNVSGQYACASIGMRFKTDRDPDAFNGKLYALRIHSTKLTENEMRKNMSCDFSRFS